MAGRPRKPTAVLELNGSFDKHPERKADRAHEPKPEGPLGPPPPDFLRENSAVAARELQAWNELIAMVPPGVLTSADRWWAERAARLMARSRYTTLKVGEENALKDYLSKVACNPADRSKVQVSVAPGTPAQATSANGTTANRFKNLASQPSSARPN